MQPPPARAASARDEFPGLDVLRFVAASMVFFSHLGRFKGTMAWLPEEGHQGVNLFFLISGFVITLTGRGGRTIALGDFYFRRFVRIYLLHSIILLAQLPWIQLSLPDLAANLLLVKGLSNRLVFSGIGQSWSLTVELLFYLSFPLLFYVMRTRVALWYLIGAGGLAVLLTLYAVGSRYYLLYTFAGRFTEFWVGMCLGYGLVKLPTLSWAWPLAILTALFTLHLFNPIADSGSGLEYRHGVLWDVTGVTVCMAIAVGTGARSASFLGLGPLLVLLGRSSYGFYLVSLGPLANGLYALFGERALPTYLLLWALSVALYLWLEKPLLDFIYKRSPFRRGVRGDVGKGTSNLD